MAALLADSALAPVAHAVEADAEQPAVEVPDALGLVTRAHDLGLLTDAQARTLLDLGPCSGPGADPVACAASVVIAIVVNYKDQLVCDTIGELPCGVLELAENAAEACLELDVFACGGLYDLLTDALWGTVMPTCDQWAQALGQPGCQWE